MPEYKGEIVPFDAELDAAIRTASTSKITPTKYNTGVSPVVDTGGKSWTCAPRWHTRSPR